MATDAWLVDASVYVFRGWFSISPQDRIDRDGRPVNALFGFVGFLTELYAKAAPTHALVAFDEALTGSAWRNRIYPPYKQNRELPPAELDAQFARCIEFARALGLPVAVDPELEADDLIASAAASLREAGKSYTVISSDKDLTQLVGDSDRWWDYARGLLLDRAGVHERHGVWPEQIADLLALAGDPVDNIPGCKGIGPKTALALLDHFGSLDEVLAKSEEIAYLKLRGAARACKLVREQRAEIAVARQITALRSDSARVGLAMLQRVAPDWSQVRALCDSAGFGPYTLSRLERSFG